jgi:hypothetical protein
MGSNARKLGLFRWEANTLLVLAGVNLKIVPMLTSATKRLPLLSKARPTGPLSPEAKVLFAPAGVNLEIAVPSESDS